MNINAYEMFGMDLSDDSLTTEFAIKMPECPEGTLLIDMSGCIIDYTATSIMMDAAIERLERARPPRELIVVFNIKFPGHLFLKWLFLGSKLLNLAKDGTKDSDVSTEVSEGLKRRGIILQIQIVEPKTKSEVCRFTYGQ